MNTIETQPDRQNANNGPNIQLVGWFETGPFTVEVTRSLGGPTHQTERKYMLSWTLAFLIIALLAALLGFSGIAGTAAWIAQVSFVIFLVLFLASLLVGRRRV